MRYRILSALLVFLISSTLLTAQSTWEGTTSSMNTSGNWMPSGVPAGGASLTFPMGGFSPVNNDIPGTYTIGNWSINDTYDFTGNSIAIASQSSPLFTFTASNALIDFSSVSLSASSSVWEIISTSGGNLIQSNITGSGQLTLESGLLYLGGTNTYSGLTTLGAGATTILKPLNGSSAGALSPNSAYIIGAGATLDLNGTSPTIGGLGGNPASTSPMLPASSVLLGAGTLSINVGNSPIPFYGVIAGTGNVAITGGTTTFMGSNTFSGALQLENGANLNTLDFGASTSLQFSNGGGTIAVLSSFSYAHPITLNGPASISTNSYNVTLSGMFTGTNPLYKLGLGTLTLSGPNAGGNYYIEGGVLNLNTTTIGTNPLTFQTSGGTLQAAVPLTINQTITLSVPGTIDTNGNGVSITNTISGGGDFIKEGTGTLTLSGSNTYSGRTIVKDGTLSVPQANYSTSTKQIVFQPSIYSSPNPIFQMGSQYTNLTSSVVFTANGTIDTNGTNSVISGVIAGPSGNSFTKAGAGTLNLSGANTYSGPTIVSVGTLQAGVGQASTLNPCTQTTTVSSGAFGVGSNITVNMGATLDFQTYANTVGSIDNFGTILSSNTVTATSFTQHTTSTPSAITLTIPNSGTPYGNVTTTGAIALTGNLTIPATTFIPSSNEIVLFQSSASGTVLTGTFQNVTIPGTLGTIHYDYTDNTVYLGSSTCNGDWQTAGSSTWGNSANWVGGCVPGTGGAMNQDAATFPSLGAGSYTATLANSGGSAPLSVTLHDINFTSTNTIYTIQQFSSSSQIILDKASSGNSKPRITMSATAAATINAPIVLNTDSRITLASGTLTLGASTTVTSMASTTSTLYISEGNTSGSLINNGSITPYAINMQGGTLTNGGTISPTNTLSIAGLKGIPSPLSLTNNSTLSSGTALTIGGAGGNTTVINTNMFTAGTTLTIGDSSATIMVTNSGTMRSMGAFTINSGTIANNSGGILNAAAGQTLTISGGTLTNASGASLGLSSAMLTVTGTSSLSQGTLTTSAQALASNYTQGQYGTLTLNYPTNSSMNPYGNILTTGTISLNGTLNVTDSGNYMPSSGAEIVLLKSSGSGTKQLSGTFSSVTLASQFSGGQLTYDPSDNQVVLGFSNCNGNWQSTSSGNWANTGNWVGGCAPGVTAPVLDVANFPNVGAGAITATLAVSGGGAPQSVTLHDIVFEASTTVYTIQQYSAASQIILANPSMANSKPRITMSGTAATINAPIVLNADSRIYLSSGTLTLGPSTSITGASNTLYISEGTSSGTLINNGSITPNALIMQGGTIQNSGTVSPTTSLTIAGLQGIITALTVTNSSTMTAGTTFTIGGGGGSTVVTNNKTMQAGGAFMVLSGTVTNNGQMNAASGQTFTISGGAVTNASGATLGLSTSNMTFSGGSLVNSGQVLANNYTQSGSASLQMDVTNLTTFGSVNASGTASLGGSLIVSAQPGFSLTNGQTIDLITAKNGISYVSSICSTASFQNFPSTVIPTLSCLANSVTLNIAETIPAHINGGSLHIIFTSISEHNALITQKCYQMQNRFKQPLPKPPKKPANGPFPQEDLVASNEVVQNPPIRQKQAQLAQKIQEGKATKTPWNVYIGPVASFGSVKTEGKQIGVGYSSVGGVAGFDYILTDAERRWCSSGIGAVVEFRKKRLTADDHFGTSTIDRLHGSLYGTLVPKGAPNLAFDAIAGFAYNWDHLKRNAGPTLSQTAFGNTNERIWDFLFDVEYTFSSAERTFSFIPLANIQYIFDHIDGYTERGAGIYDLKVSSQRPESLTTTVGFRADCLYASPSFSFRAQLDAGWRYEYLNLSQAIEFTPFTIGSEPTLVNTVAPGRNSLLLALDLLTTTRKGWQIEALATYQLNRLLYDAFFYLGFGKNF